MNAPTLRRICAQSGSSFGSKTAHWVPRSIDFVEALPRNPSGKILKRELRKQYGKEEDFMLALKEWQREHPIPTGSVRTVVDHIDHIARVAGVDHVGLGSDFDGINVVPKQLEDVSCYPYITQALLDRGFNREEILKVLGGNLLRVLRQAERVAKDSK